MARETIVKFVSDITGTEIPEDADAWTIRLRKEGDSKAYELDALDSDKLPEKVSDLLGKAREVGIPGKRTAKT